MEEESEVAEEAAPEGLASTRPKRSRTGCLTCRTRRRKCDEGKPHCQNCISKGFDCRYAAPFQILGKNNFTPKVESTVKYAQVHFIANSDDSGRASTRIEPESRDVASQTISHKSAANDRKPISVSSAQNDLSNAGQPLSESQSASPNSYDFALRGLLELGSGNRAITSPQYGYSNGLRHESADAANPNLDDHIDPALSTHDSSFTEIHAAGHRWTPTIQAPDEPPVATYFEAPNTVTSTATLSSGSNQQVSRHAGDYEQAGTSTLPWSDSPVFLKCGESLELLKYYRYNVAPWLDICDSEQYFGVCLVTTSSRDAAIRAAISAISEAATCQNRNTGEVDVQQDGSSKAILTTLDLVLDVTKDLTRFWDTEEHDTKARRSIENSLLQLGGNSRQVSSAYWLSVRLGLSCALLSTIPIRIPLPLDTHHVPSSGKVDHVSFYAQAAIALCVDAVMFSHGDDDRWLQQRYGLNRVETWKTLIQSFAHWYMHRSQEFQPIIELYPKDGLESENDFPSIVFTSGAALLANQLYHTGMLLLLQSKPRFVEKPMSNSSSMSILWHAHRICGIAIQNDGRSTWDPSLVASLIVAARTVTHRSQHDAVVGTLEAVQSLTGWEISRHIDELKSEWRLAEG